MNKYKKYKVQREKWFRIKQRYRKQLNKRTMHYTETRYLKLSCGHWHPGGGKGDTYCPHHVGQLCRCYVCEMNAISKAVFYIDPHEMICETE